MGKFRDYNLDLRKSNLILVIFELFICLEMIIGYSIVNYCGVIFDSIPLNDPLFLLTISVPLSYNVLIIIILHDIFTRLSTIVELTEVKNVCVLSTYYLRKRINLVMILFDKINDSVLSINRCYTFNIIVALLNITAIFIFMTFLLYDTLIHGVRRDDIILVMGGYSYFICFFGSFIAIIYFSEFIKKTHLASTINFTTVNILLCDRKIYKSINLAIHQLTHFQKDISCLLFAFNWKALLLLFACIFDYVIVMIQFNNMISMGY